MAVARPIAVPCQMKRISAQPIDWTSGVSSSGSVTGLLLVLFQQAADLPQLLRGGRRRGKGLHHQPTGRAAKGAIDQVSDQVPLRFLLRDGRAVQVDAAVLLSH